MVPKFEIVADASGSFLFQLVDAEGRVLLKSTPEKGKITVQNLVQHARKAVQGDAHWQTHEAKDGRFFMTLREEKHSLGSTPAVASKEALAGLLASIRDVASRASIIDHSKPRPASTEH